jgi:hypothetical protein
MLSYFIAALRSLDGGEESMLEGDRGEKICDLIESVSFEC